MYSTQVRRETINALREERLAHVRAVLSNGGFLQSDEAIKARAAEIKRIDKHFQEALDAVTDPGRAAREQRQFENNPFFAASLRTMDRNRWDFASVSGALG